MFKQKELSFSIFAFFKFMTSDVKVSTDFLLWSNDATPYNERVLEKIFWCTFNFYIHSILTVIEAEDMVDIVYSNWTVELSDLA